MRTSFSISPSTSLLTGMCVHLLTTAAMSLLVDLLLEHARAGSGRVAAPA